MNNLKLMKKLEDKLLKRLEFKFNTIMEIMQENNYDTYHCNISLELNEHLDSILEYLLENELNNLFTDYKGFTFEKNISSVPGVKPSVIINLQIKKD